MSKTKNTKAPKRRGLNLKKAQEKHEQVESRSNSQYFELKEGWNKFILLPPWSDEEVLWKEVERHGYHVCPKRLGIRECVICKEIRKRLKKGDTDFADEWRLKPTAYFNAIMLDDVKSKDPDKVKVLRVSTKIFSEILEWINDEDVDPSDPTEAYPMWIKRKGTGKQTRYKLKFAKEPIDVSKYITDAFLEEALIDLDTIRGVQPSSDKEMRQAIRGKKDSDGDDWADDDDDDVDADDFSDDDDDMDVSDDDDQGEDQDDFDDDADEDDDAEEDTVFSGGDDEDDDDPEDADDDEDADDEDDQDDDDDGLTDDEEAALLAEMDDDEDDAEEEPEPPPAPKKKTSRKKPAAKKPAASKKPAAKKPSRKKKG